MMRILVDQNSESNNGYLAVGQELENGQKLDKINIDVYKACFLLATVPKGTKPYDIYSRGNYEEGIDNVLAEVNGKLWDMNKPLERYCFVQFNYKESCQVEDDDEWYNLQSELHEASGSEDEPRIIMIAVRYNHNRKLLNEIAGHMSPLDVVHRLFKEDVVTKTSHQFKANGEEIDPETKLMEHSIIELFKRKSNEEVTKTSQANGEEIGRGTKSMDHLVSYLSKWKTEEKEEGTKTSHQLKVNGEKIRPRTKSMDYSIIYLYKRKINEKRFFKIKEVTKTSHLLKANGEEIGNGIGHGIKLMDYSIIKLFKQKTEKMEAVAADKNEKSYIKVAILTSRRTRSSTNKKTKISPKTFFNKIYSKTCSVNSFITLVNGHITSPYDNLETESDIYFVNPQKNIKVDNDHHSISYFDEQLKMNWYYSMMIPHVIDCQLPDGKKCSFSWCNTLKEIINHVNCCPNEIECSTRYCAKVGKILTHKDNCSSTSCLTCDAMEHAKYFQPHPMSPFCYTNNSDPSSNHKPKNCKLTRSTSKQNRKSSVSSAGANIDVRDVASTSSDNQASGAKVFMPFKVSKSRINFMPSVDSTWRGTFMPNQASTSSDSILPFQASTSIDRDGLLERIRQISQAEVSREENTMGSEVESISQKEDQVLKETINDHANSRPKVKRKLPPSLLVSPNSKTNAETSASLAPTNVNVLDIASIISDNQASGAKVFKPFQSSTTEIIFIPCDDSTSRVIFIPDQVLTSRDDPVCDVHKLFSEVESGAQTEDEEVQTEPENKRIPFKKRIFRKDCT